MRRGLFVLAVVAALSIAGAALAGGGTTIATAPDLPVGQQVTGGGSPTDDPYCVYREFWRIALTRGDQLKVDFGTLNGYTVIVYVYSPSTTDYNFNEGNSLASAGTNDKGELKYVAAGSGRYLLYLRTASCDVDLAYELTAYVRHYTHAILSGPSIVRKGSRIRLRGQITGASAGRAAMQVLKHRHWRNLGLVSIGAGGKFSYATRARKPGLERLRVVYYGDNSHLPTRAAFSFHIV